MCGIAGVVSKSLELESIISNMCSNLAHRGPDGEGIYVGDGIALGHRRLAILDLSEKSRQPFPYSDRYFISYNGEIYNYIELRNELEALGYSFTSEGDTEVLGASFDCWGVEAFKKFNGMWAVAIYDKYRQTLTLSRDRFGVKPLFYSINECGLFFSSEIKSLLGSGSVPGAINKNEIDNYLKDGPSEWKSESCFENIYRFPMASYSTISVKNPPKKIKANVFWEFPPLPKKERFKKENLDKYSSEYLRLLNDAVKLRLRADVTVGTALSGGLDSTSVAFFVQEQQREVNVIGKQKLFSSVYTTSNTKYCDESELISLFLEQLDAVHFTVEPHFEDVIQEYKSIMQAMENPPETSCMSGWSTYKLISKNGVKVSLDGQGADEALGGYHYYIPTYLAGSTFLDAHLNSIHFFRNNVKLKLILKGLVLRYMRFFFGVALSKSLLLRLRGINADFCFDTQSRRDFKTSLVNMTAGADRESMAHGVESRMPFLDYRLVEFLFSVPGCYKFHNGWTKYLARYAMSDKLPKPICWNKQKKGWPTPDEYWFHGPLKVWMEKSIMEGLAKHLNYLRVEPLKASLNVKIRLLNLVHSMKIINK